MAVNSFAGKLAVVTGGGSSMGRELVRQLAAQGCSVAACDLNADTVAVTAATARAGAPPGVRITGHACDVSDQAGLVPFQAIITRRPLPGNARPFNILISVSLMKTQATR